MTRSNGSRTEQALVREVAAIYEWLDQAAIQAGGPASACRRCGRCCDLEAYGHRLFLTTPEWIAFRQGLGGEPVRPMPSGRCPYNEGGLCTVYAIRFAGCRIFRCGLDTQAQSGIAESALVRLKALCIQYAVPYRYVDLATALNGPWPERGRSVRAPQTGGRGGRCT
ncbi:MAG: hypothetical protein KBE04_05150 [Phycisphaerae bacterium]|nr:hypothetical protein [Phycisphaerae bacterium]